MSHGAWTAAQCAEVAVHKVIGPLEDQLQESAAPNAHEGLVIGGESTFSSLERSTTR